MLKGIPSILSPDLLKILQEMGHGDTIVIVDANFPAASCAKRLVRADGHNLPDVLSAVMQLLPLDTYSEYQAGLMEVVPGDTTVPVIWDTIRKIVAEHEDIDVKYEFIERFEYYKRTRDAFAVVSTGETALYANIILKKGVIAPIK
ncbi:MAG: fucose isomerase [Spirochaetales bacterium]|nr:fucose isomerase [Spirochaetales bacterium]